MKTFALLALSFSTLLIYTGCNKSEPSWPEAAHTTLANGEKLALYSETGQLRSGYNTVKIFLDGSPARFDSLSVLQNGHSSDGAVQALEGAGDFEILLGQAGDWELGGVSTSGIPVSIPFKVKKRVPDYIRTIIGPDSTRYLFAIVQPRVPKYGIERFEAAVYRLDGDTFRPATGLRLKLRPWMHMEGEKGHSSQYNENPVSDPKRPGHYLGKIAFSMKGVWEVQLPVFTSQGNVVDTVRFEANVLEKSE